MWLWRGECVALLRRCAQEVRRRAGGYAHLDLIWTESLDWRRKKKEVAQGPERVQTWHIAGNGRDVLAWVHPRSTSTNFLWLDVSPKAEAEETCCWNVLGPVWVCL